MRDPFALNRQFERFDQVQKSHTYSLAENASDEFDDEYQIATLDLAAYLDGDLGDKARFAEQFVGALSEIGFAVLIGHGIEATLYEQMHDEVLEIFTATPLEQKLRFRAKRWGSVNQGYFPLEETSDIHPDLVEGWVFCRRAFDLPNRGDPATSPCDFWPRATFEQSFRRLVSAHEKLFKPLARAMLQGLGCDPHLFDAKLTRTNFGLRLNYYPPMTGDQSTSGAGRLLGHEDVDLFTLLPAPATEGLQVWNHVSGKWVRLNAPPGSLIINTGDYMQRISNDRLPSTTHRVSKPSGGSQLTSARVSFPTNVYLWENEVLEVLPGLGAPRYEPIKAISFHTRSTSKFYGEGYAVDLP